MKWVSQLSRKPKIAILLLCFLVLAIVFALWGIGNFQSIECVLRDRAIAVQPELDAQNVKLAIVGIDEADIKQFGWALDDTTLARALDLIALQRPSVVGLDLYRDLPEPRAGPFTPALGAALQKYTNVVCAYLARDESPVEPPPSIAAFPDRIGFNAFPADDDGDVVRRALLFTFPRPDRGFLYSLAFQMCRHHWRTHGQSISLSPTEAGPLVLGKTQLKPFPRSAGGYVREENVSDFQLLLDYRGGRNVTKVSLADILKRRIATNLLTDRIVLIGMMASSVNDFVNTPLKSGEYGVRLHAQVVDQLLRLAEGVSRPVKYLNHWMEVLLVLACGAAGQAAGSWARKPLRFGFALLSGSGFLASLHWSALWQDWWLPFVPSFLAFVGCAVLVMSFMAYQEKVMRDTLMVLLSRQVSSDIAQDLWAQRDAFLDGGRPKTQALTVTVLFSDLKGFSTISEALDPGKLYAWLNRYLGEMADIVGAHHGVLKQFTGDGLMAIFGVPTPHTEREQLCHDARCAVHCALAMAKRLTALDEEWQRSNQPTVSMRIGIYTGSVAAGSIGSANRFEYAVIGDVVNTASRLESYDKSLADPDQLPLRTRILIGAPTYDLVAANFVATPLGHLKVKGKQNEVAVYQIHSAIGGAAASSAKSAKETK